MGLGPDLGGRYRVWLCPFSQDKGTWHEAGAGLHLLGGRGAFLPICLGVSEEASRGPGELREREDIVALLLLPCRGCWGHAHSHPDEDGEESEGDGGLGTAAAQEELFGC